MKRLLTVLKDKWPEYLFEIIVLIVGIYGAFALENWHDDREDRKDEVYFLNQMKHELTSDSLYLSDLKVRLKKKIPSIKKMINVLNESKGKAKYSNVFLDYINDILFVPYFVSNSATFDEMKSSGKLGLIQDKQLRNEIIILYNNLSVTERVLIEENHFLRPQDIDLSYEHNMAKFLKEQEILFNNIIDDAMINGTLQHKEDLESNAANHHWSTTLILPVLDGQLDEIRSMLKKIDAELLK